MRGALLKSVCLLGQPHWSFVEVISGTSELRLADGAHNSFLFKRIYIVRSSKVAGSLAERNSREAMWISARREDRINGPRHCEAPQFDVF